MRTRTDLLASTALCSMAQEGAEEQGAGGGASKAEQVGGVTRVQTGDGGDADAEATARAAQGGKEVQKDLKGEAPEDKAKTPEEIAAAAEAAKIEAAKAGEGKDGDKAKDVGGKTVDLKGTIFEGLSPEMQGKIMPYAAAYAENGTLTDAEVTEAAHASGFSEAAVRQLMRGADLESQDALAAKFKPVYDVAGSKEAFGEFQKWTGEEGNVSEAEERAINKVLAEDPEAGATLLQPLIERWKAAGGGTAARDITEKGKEGGDGGDASKAKPFKSWAEQLAAQEDPRYKSDPAYREEVYARVAASSY